jgi:all-beta uncharacterized protein
MRVSRFLQASALLAAALLAVRCSSSSPASPTATSTTPSALAVTTIVTGVQTADGSVATQQAGSPPAANGGPTVTATSSDTIINGNHDVVALQGAAPFQTVYVSVPNTSGITAFANGRFTPLAAANGFFELRLPTPATSVLLILNIAASVTNGSTFTLAYAVASPAGLVGPTTTLTKTASGGGCAFGVAPTSVPVGAASTTASVTVTVTSGSNCAWTAAAGDAFITITQGATGSGGGTVQFTVAANGGAARTGTLVVAGVPVTITQAPAATGTNTLSAPSPNSPVGGITLPADLRRPTLVVNNAAASGAASGAVTYRFELSDLSSFPADPARTFTADGVPQGSGTTGWVVDRDLGSSVTWYWHARATNGTVTTAYSGTETFKTPDPPCSFTVSPTTISATAAGEGAPVNITRTAGNCSWSAAFDQGWIVGPATGANGSFTFNAAANTDAGPRTGHITISWAGGKTVVTINQAAPDAQPLQCTFTLLDDGLSHFTLPLSSTSLFVTLTASPPTCDWSLSLGSGTQASMFTIKPTSGVGNGNVEVIVNATRLPRSGSIVATAGPGKTGSATFSVDQVAPPPIGAAREE